MLNENRDMKKIELLLISKETKERLEILKQRNDYVNYTDGLADLRKEIYSIKACKDLYYIDITNNSDIEEICHISEYPSSFLYVDIYVENPDLIFILKNYYNISKSLITFKIPNKELNFSYIEYPSDFEINIEIDKIPDILSFEMEKSFSMRLYKICNNLAKKLGIKQFQMNTIRGFLLNEKIDCNEKVRFLLDELKEDDFNFAERNSFYINYLFYNRNNKITQKNAIEYYNYLIDKDYYKAENLIVIDKCDKKLIDINKMDKELYYILTLKNRSSHYDLINVEDELTDDIKTTLTAIGNSSMKTLLSLSMFCKNDRCDDFIRISAKYIINDILCSEYRVQYPSLSEQKSDIKGEKLDKLNRLIDQMIKYLEYLHSRHPKGFMFERIQKLLKVQSSDLAYLLRNRIIEVSKDKTLVKLSINNNL